MKTLILILFICHSLCSCVSHATNPGSIAEAPNNFIDPFTMISEGRALLKEGDLVVRLNQDPTSQFIKNFNRIDKSYSHAGIVFFENGCPYIFHIVNGEENPDEKLKKDSLSRFCNPRKNIAYGIFRYDINAGEIKRLRDIIHQWYAKGVRFDSIFNLKTDNRMYCSEMIMKALAKATRKRILIETTKPTTAEAGLFSAYMHLPLAYTNQLRIVSIDNLYTNPFCHLVKEFSFEKK